jgi:homoserine kinase
MTAKAFAPATVANVACGFDVLGLTLAEPGDTVTTTRADEPGIALATIEGDDGRLPREPTRNTATVAARDLMERMNVAPDVGVRVELQKGLPLESGMGSSAASAVAAVVAVDHLLGLGATRLQLLTSALEGERIAAGAGHGDNAAASLYGGFVLVRPAHAPSELEVVPLPIPEGLAIALVRPHLEVSTKDSRVLLGDVVKLESAVAQWANLGALVAGLYSEDWELVSRSLEDHIAEPIRSQAVPGFHDVKRAALDEGALGAGLSGSGPSMFALCRDLDTAERASKRMVETFANAAGLESDRHVSPISARGAHIIELASCAS